MTVFVVSIDGPDFCGKTTIANIVTELLRKKYKNLKIKRTELPTSFVTGAFTDILRSVKEETSQEVFALVYAADHLFHYLNSIKPLEESKENFLLIQERSLLTTYIYQGILGKVDFSWLDEINKYDKNKPILTLILKVPVQELKNRKSLSRRLFDAFEAKDYLEKQAEVYYNLPKDLVKKFNVEYVEAYTEPLEVAERCAEIIGKKIEELLNLKT
jgi:thymidylate kinase